MLQRRDGSFLLLAYGKEAALVLFFLSALSSSTIKQFLLKQVLDLKE